MAIDPRPSGDEVTVDINTTPLIDVMLVLLILLIITIPARTDAVKLDLPAAPMQSETVAVTIAIGADGSMRWNGAVLADRAALERALAAAAAQAPQPEIHIAPDPAARFAYVATALAEAQRLGVTKIGIASSEQLE